MKNTTLIFTCEHAGNEVPAAYQDLLKPSLDLLQTHRGYDPGTDHLGEVLSKAFKARLFKTNVTRLLVDVNRSLWRRTLFSEFTKPLKADEKKEILDKFYYPHRNEIANYFETLNGQGKAILHIALHSFTPVLNGNVRQADIGLLYDPSRKNEKAFCATWKKIIMDLDNVYRVRFNYPYLGKPDGLTAHFRKHFYDAGYIGIELEINQKYALQNCFDEALIGLITKSVEGLMARYQWL